MSDNKHASCTFICSKDALDGAYPPLILAINAKRLGMDATVFFTFMGINVIRKERADKCKFYPPGFLGSIPGMATLATKMMKKKIDNANVPMISELLEMAQLEGVKLVACMMTTEMLGLKEDNFIEGVEIQNAEGYLKHARDCGINMFI